MQAAEARKRAGFDVKEKDAPAWMRKPASSVPARPQSRSGRIRPFQPDALVSFPLTGAPDPPKVALFTGDILASLKGTSKLTHALVQHTEGVPMRAAANGHVPQASKPVTPQKPVSYAQLLNGHTTAPASAHADTDTTTEEESIADVQTTSEKSTPPKGDRALTM